jgi:hypothetical protein
MGNAELAARLGGWPVSYDRRGQVLFYNLFEDGWGPFTKEVAGSSTIYLDPAGAIQGGYAVHITNIAEASAYGLLRARLPQVAVTTPIGLACFFAPTGTFLDIQLFLNCYRSPTQYTGDVKLTLSDKKIWLYNDSGAWTEIGTWNTNHLYTYVWHYLKVVFNPSTGYYVRVIFDGIVYDASAVKCRTAATTDNALWTNFEFDSAAGGTSETLVDCLALTTQEP